VSNLASQRVKFGAQRSAFGDKVCDSAVVSGRQGTRQAVNRAFQYRPPRIIERSRRVANGIKSGRFVLGVTPTKWLVFQGFKLSFCTRSRPVSRSSEIIDDSGGSNSDRGPTWTELLRAAERGDEAGARALAVTVAAEVLASPVVVMAHQVLAGGPHATAKAIELAERLLGHGGVEATIIESTAR
jgi:hypothetical protein